MLYNVILSQTILMGCTFTDIVGGPDEVRLGFSNTTSIITCSRPRSHFGRRLSVEQKEEEEEDDKREKIRNKEDEEEGE